MTKTIVIATLLYFVAYLLFVQNYVVEKEIIENTVEPEVENIVEQKQEKQEIRYVPVYVEKKQEETVVEKKEKNQTINADSIQWADETTVTNIYEAPKVVEKIIEKPMPEELAVGVVDVPVPPVQDLSSVKFIEPIKGRGVERTIIASTEINDDSIVDLGWIVYDAKGDPIKNVVATINTTDSSQNKTLNGTGTVTPIYTENGAKIITPYYHFQYHFKTAGLHVITFTANGMSNTVEINAQ